MVRKPGSYVPPGARKASATTSGTASSTSQTTPAPPNATDGSDAVDTAAKTDVPKVSVNGPDETPEALSPVPAANKVCTDNRSIQDSDMVFFSATSRCPSCFP